MANLNVTYADIEDAASRLVHGKEELTSQLSSLQHLIAALVSGGFVTDAASGAFQSTFDRFTHGATQTVSALDGLSQFLARAAEALRQTDEGLATAISS